MGTGTLDAAGLERTFHDRDSVKVSSGWRLYSTQHHTVTDRGYEGGGNLKDNVDHVNAFEVSDIVMNIRCQGITVEEIVNSHLR